MKKIILGFLFILFSLDSYSQNSFGFELGAFGVDQFSPVYQIDNIIVGPGDNQAYNDFFYGFFYEHQFSGRFSLHQKVNFSGPYNSYIYFNEEVEGVAGLAIIKAGGVKVRRVSLEVLPQFELINSRNLKVRAFAGINLSGNYVINDREVDFRGLPGVSKVANAISTSQIPLTFNFAYGGSVEFAKRFVFWAKWQPRSYYSKEITVDDQVYPFENQWSFFSMSLGYKLYSFKFKNTLKLE